MEEILFSKKNVKTNMSLLEVQAFQQNLGANKLFTKYQNHAE